MKTIQKIQLIAVLAACCTVLFSCQQEATKNPLDFKARVVANDFENLWANCPADVNGDGITDIVMITNNAYGGSLGYYEGKTSEGIWELKIVADSLPEGGKFAMGDMEVADMDFDGDLDLVAGVHPGEWKNGTAPTQLYWFENPSWEVHPIGEAANFVKDVSLADLNKDKKMDLVVLTFDSNTLRIFEQVSKSEFTLVQNYEGYGNLHEGMDVGDLDGDGYEDIFANGHIFHNPAGQLAKEWIAVNMDNKWNSQEGDWSRNGTKTCLRDIDADGMDEVFISHSERAGYPLSMYKNDGEGNWTETVIADSIPACHTMQVADFDLDGEYDVFTGVNMGRAVGIGFDEFEVIIYLGKNGGESWTKKVIDKDGVYNGQVADYDDDGDIDIFRLVQHGATELRLFENLVYTDSEE